MPKAEWLLTVDLFKGGWVAHLIPQGLQQCRHQAKLVEFIDCRGILLKPQIVAY